MKRPPVTSFCYYQSPPVCFEHAIYFAYLHVTIPKENSPVASLSINSRDAILLLIQLHIHDDEIIRRQRLLKNRFQLFLLCHAEALGAVELREFL
jgi:hypothetical protein